MEQGRRRRARIGTTAAAVLVAAVVVAVAVGRSSGTHRTAAPAVVPSPTTRPPTPIAPPAGTVTVPPSPQALHAALGRPGVLLGASVGSSIAPPDQRIAAVTGLEHQLGRPLDFDNDFHAWTSPFPGPLQTADLATGTIPMISWNGTVGSQILDGSQDPLIDERAKALAALGKPVLLRWFWEMDARDNGGSTNGSGSWMTGPAEYVQVWRYLHDRFARDGATNVEWVWCPLTTHFASGLAQQYYPGPSYVDWVAADGYNFASVRHNPKWPTFAQIFVASGFYPWAAATGKPVMIAETGVGEGTPGRKAAWISASCTALAQYPAIRAYSYFDVNVSKTGYDWSLTTTPSALQAFAACSHSGYLNERAFPISEGP